MPYVIALETSEDSATRNKAVGLHTDLHGKYASFIHNKNVDGLRVAYEFQKATRPLVSGIQISDTTAVPVSIMAPLYDVIRDKRALRKDFLSNVVRLFDLANAQEQKVLHIVPCTLLTV